MQKPSKILVGLGLAALLATSACAPSKENPRPDNQQAPSVEATQSASPTAPPARRGLIPNLPGAEPDQGRPVDIEPQPWSADRGEVYMFRTVVDEVTRYCLVLVGRDTGGLHCFDSSEVP